MDCREMQALLTAFHDGELPVDDRVRVEEHLRVCPGCGARLADLARADQAAVVPDPGSAYWDRFNARVMDRVEREGDGQGWPSAEAGRDATGSIASADGPRVAVLRPKGGWMRQQLRYLVPAAAAAALVVVVVRYGGIQPAVPPTARDGQVPGQAGMPRALEPRPAVSEPSASDSSGERAAVVRRVPEESSRVGGAPAAPSPAIPDERNATDVREERDRMADGHGRPSAGTGRDAPGSVVPADRSLPAGNQEASRDRATAPPAISVPSPPPMTFRGANDVSPPAPAADGRPSGMEAERKKMAGEAAQMAEPQKAGKAKSASGVRIAKEPELGSPCELARTLAAQERWREAEDAQRACLAKDRQAPAQEKGLVFLAELLDRQARFAEADAVITEVERQFPQSRPLDLYRQQRPMVQTHPTAVPVTR